MNTVLEYRRAGYKVRVTHYRYAISLHNLACCHGNPKQIASCYELHKRHEIRANVGNGTEELYVHPKGGMTEIEITHPTMKGMGDVPYTITIRAKCSKKDNYNNKLGVKICLGRVDKDEFTTNFN
jgi:hypothetical protein